MTISNSLGPALVNIFVEYYENKLFASVEKPLLYTRYTDDMFAIFRSEAEADKFFTALYFLLPALKFTIKKKGNLTLLFRDVKIEKDNSQFLSSVYRKPSFTDQYIPWDSFGPSKHKINLIETLVHQALVICSKGKL